MFNFLHPQPVARQKPVAEMVVRQESRVSVSADTVLIAKPSRSPQENLLGEVKAQDTLKLQRR
jgi:hypothetical protein